MFNLVFKVVLLFTTGIIIMRIMGKSAITQLTPYDLIAIIIIGTVVAEPLISTKVKPTLLVLLILTVLYVIYSKMSLNQFFNKLLLGRPTILIKHGKIIEKNIEREHISLIQLTSMLRVSGYPKLEDIEYAILEPTGEVSIIPKPEARTVTISDLNLQAEYEGLPIGVIIDGKIQEKNLKLINKNINWLEEKLKERGIDDIKDVVYAYASDEREDIVFDLRNENKLINDNYKKNIVIEERQYELIKNGQLNLNVLNTINIDEQRIKEILNIKNISHLKENKNILIKEIRQLEIIDKEK